MFYDINGKVYMYELIDNLSTHFSVANNELNNSFTLKIGPQLQSPE